MLNPRNLTVRGFQMLRIEWWYGRDQNIQTPTRNTDRVMFCCHRDMPALSTHLGIQCETYVGCLMVL